MTAHFQIKKCSECIIGCKWCVSWCYARRFLLEMHISGLARLYVPYVLDAPRRKVRAGKTIEPRSNTTYQRVPQNKLNC